MNHLAAHSSLSRKQKILCQNINMVESGLLDRSGKGEV